MQQAAQPGRQARDKEAPGAGKSRPGCGGSARAREALVNGPTMRDAQTLPAALQLPAALCLLALGAWFGLCYQYTLNRQTDDFYREHGAIIRFSAFQMFTEKSVTQATTELEAQGADGAWTLIDMPTLFPAIWDSRFRYEDPAIRSSNTHRQILAAATCSRLLARGEAPLAVRLVVVRWRKTLGSVEQPRKRDLKRDQLLVWDCSKTPPLPAGVRR